MNQAALSLRKQLHQHPELSNAEYSTAATIVERFGSLSPDGQVSDLGGTGVAFTFAASDQALANQGPTTVFRCELDALPIQEVNTFEHRSVHDGVSHKCGHDGHMAIIYSVAQYLSENRPSTGRVVLLFQPAEETGEGAQAVVDSENYSLIKPDYCFALHNLPGAPAGQVRIKEGLFNFASIGLSITLKGKESHAAHPEDGDSPALMMCQIIEMLQTLAERVEGEHYITVVSAQLGEYGFGTAPGDALVTATLRSTSNDDLDMLVATARENIDMLSEQHQYIQHDVSFSDHFTTCFNSPKATQMVIDACTSTGTDYQVIDQPYRWSEDFGRLLESANEGAMFTLGAGENSPQLHNPDYDFNDQLIEVANRVFVELIVRIHNRC